MIPVFGTLGGLISFLLLLFLVTPSTRYRVQAFFVSFQSLSILTLSVVGGMVSIPFSLVVAASWIPHFLKLLFRIQSLPFFVLMGIFFVTWALISTILSSFFPVSEILFLRDGYLQEVERGMRPYLRWLMMLVYFMGAIGLAYWLRDANRIWLLLRIVLYGITFSSLWGFYQIILYFNGYDYPWWLFNNSLSESARGYDGVALVPVIGLMPRISSVALEPSLFAQASGVASIISFFMLKSSIHKTLIANVLLSLVLLINLTACILTFSFTSVLLVLFLLYVMIVFLLPDRLFVKALWLLLISVSIGVVVLGLGYYYDIDDSQKWGYSAFERAHSLQSGIIFFLESPLYGSGWAVLPVHDLWINLAANIGLPGAFLFLVFIIYTYKGLFKINREYFIIPAILSWVLLASICTGLAYHISHFWLCFSMAWAITMNSIVRSSKVGTTLSPLANEDT